MKHPADLEIRLANIRLRTTRQAREKTLTRMLSVTPDHQPYRRIPALVAVLVIGAAFAAAFLMTPQPRPEHTVTKGYTSSEDALTVKSLNRALAQGGMEGLIAQARRRSPERPQSPTLDDFLSDIDF